MKIIHRLPSAAWTLLRAFPLLVQNLASRSSVLDSKTDAVISLTSHGSRVKFVFVTIESIARGNCRPQRLILYLDGTRSENVTPRSLRRLQRRGLEIVHLANNKYGPHTKYYPYVTSISKHTKPLVTADDDILYPATWLSDLVMAHVAEPNLIVANRVREIQFEFESGFRPYGSWQPARTVEPHAKNFLTGVSGAIYPADFLNALGDAGDSFLATCPKADDIWLNVVALRNGILVKQRLPYEQHYLVVPLTQRIALSATNNTLGQNDCQISLTYSTPDRLLLRTLL